MAVTYDISDVESVKRAADRIIKPAPAAGRLGQQRRHHGHAGSQERPGVGHGLSHQPSRALRALRSLAAPPAPFARRRQ